MPPKNGFDSDAVLLERLISLVARFNALADGWDKRFSSLEQQQDTGFEAVREEVRKEVGELRDIVLNIQFQLGRVREDTDPRLRLPTAAELQPPKPKHEDGALVEAARVVEKVPPSLRRRLLELAVSLTVGVVGGIKAWLMLKAGH